jgi:phosphocarrier protein
MGVHARPSASIVERTQKYKSKIRIQKDQESCDCKSIMEIMFLAIEYGEEITIVVDGEDEQRAMDDLTQLIESGFEESY